MPPDRRTRETPGTATRGSHGDRDSAPTKPPTVSIVPQPTPWTVEVVETLATVLIEMRPGLAPAVAASMVVEAFDQAACSTLDAEWAAAREAIYPAALRAAHARHSLLSFTRRRAQQLDDIKPRPGDYPGRLGSAEWRKALDNAREIELCPNTCEVCWVPLDERFPGRECRPPLPSQVGGSVQE
jgi:hypothetical protein